MTRPTAVVVGSLHYDIFVDAPHRPVAGETVTGKRWAPKFGGKGGNQAIALAQAGCDVRLVSAVGDDAFGHFLLDQLARAGISTRHVAKLGATSSGMSVAISDETGDYGAVIVSGANLEIPATSIDAEGLWENAGYLVLQNEITPELNGAAARMAQRHGVPVCLNAAPWRPLDPTLLGMLDLLILNEVEASAMTDLDIATLEDARRACAWIGDVVPAVIVTAGGLGAASCDRGSLGAVAGEAVEVVSTHGAGDHFIGVLVAELISGASLAGAVRRANASAGRFVSQV